MMGPSQADLARYTPRAPAGVLELNISDHWRAKWVDADELPEDAPVFHAYAVVYKGDKGYVTRPAGETHWRTVEGDVQNDEDIDSFLARTVYEQMGIRIKKSELVGFLECKATTRNPKFEVGTITPAVYRGCRRDRGCAGGVGLRTAADDPAGPQHGAAPALSGDRRVHQQGDPALPGHLREGRGLTVGGEPPLRVDPDASREHGERDQPSVEER